MWKMSATRTYGVTKNSFLRILLYLMLLICLSAGNTWGQLVNNPMNYRDYTETVYVMRNLEARSDYVTLKKIGTSHNNPEHPFDNGTPIPTNFYDIYAMRIGPVGANNLPQNDGDNAPSILFIGGIHGREWLGSESLLMLAEHLVEKLEDPYPFSDELALLRRVAVWIIPIANPAGRIIDDEHSGDPTQFYIGTGNTEHGWRHSADRRGCAAATDIARNFDYLFGGSTDSTCDSGWENHFKGLAAFSTGEAKAIREFVQNHWISMAVDVHTKDQYINNVWRADPDQDDVAGQEIRKKAIKIWKDGLENLADIIYPRPIRGQPGSRYGIYLQDWRALKRTFVGNYALLDDYPEGGASQDATGWLANVQHIPSFIIELPQRNGYYDDDSIFLHEENDNSNAFHPSSSRVTAFIEESFIPMATYLIGQAAAPGSATEMEYYTVPGKGKFVDYNQEIDGSHTNDVGILAAKIGEHDEPGAPGQIDSESFGRRRLYYDSQFGWQADNVSGYDYLDPSSGYDLHYWVQNYGLYETLCYIELKLKRKSIGAVSWEVEETEFRTYEQLPSLGRVYDSFSFKPEEDMIYELTIKVAQTIPGDEFKLNNEKVFSFYTPSRR